MSLGETLDNHKRKLGLDPNKTLPGEIYKTVAYPFKLASNKLNEKIMTNSNSVNEKIITNSNSVNEKINDIKTFISKFPDNQTTEDLKKQTIQKLNELIKYVLTEYGWSFTGNELTQIRDEIIIEINIIKEATGKIGKDDPIKDTKNAIMNSLDILFRFVSRTKETEGGVRKRHSKSKYSKKRTRKSRRRNPRKRRTSRK